MRRQRGVYKRGNVWWIAYTLLDGTTVRESARTSNLKEAEDKLNERKNEAKEGKALARPTKNYTFQELAKEYASWSSRQRFFRTKRYFIKQLVERFGTLPLNSFNALTVEKYQTELLKEVKPATVNRRISCLKHMFKKAYEWELVSEHVLNKVRSVKLLKEPPGRLRYLSQEEIQTLVDACVPHLRPIVIVAVHTGMRLGEILNLKWEQVDLKHGFILLDVTKSGGRREIPINATLRATLDTLPRGPESLYLFANKDGNPYQRVKRSFVTACKRAGIRDFTFHDLRHTFASQMVMAGVDIRTVQELLGHKTLTMTVRYSHLAPSHKVRAISILEERLTGDKEQRCTSHLLHNFREGDELCRS
ncbi:MAG: tyrosine-type recombinase/integrase [Candidatus Brocadiales bacterium]